MHTQVPAIQLIINSPSADDLNEKVVSLARQFGVTLPSVIGTPVETVSSTAGQAKEAPKSDAPAKEKTSAKKGKEEKEVPKTEVTKEVVATESTNQTPVKEQSASSTKTVEDVKAALQKLSSSKGITALKEFLATFKNKDGAACAKVSDVQATDYDALITQVEEKLA